MRETQSEYERDIDLAYEWKLAPDGMRGTIPELRRDIPKFAAQRLGIEDAAVSRETLSRQQVLNLAAARRADGKPTGRGFKVYKEGSQSKNRHFIDVTMTTDKSWSILLETAETAAMRALLQEMLKNANHSIMHQINDERGYTRRGRQFRLERGELVWVSFTHHTTRPTQDGRVYPFFHMHNVVTSNVIAPSGHVGAIHTAHLNKYYMREKTAELQNLISAGAKRLGIDVKRDHKTGSVSAACVPDKIRMAMSMRGQDMNRYIEQWCERKGVDWQTMTRHQRRPVEEQARRQTQSAYHDGIATRAEWRRDLSKLGWTPADRGSPWKAFSSAAGPVLKASASLLDRARQLRQDVQSTWRLAKHTSEMAATGRKFLGSPALAATLARALKPTLTRQAVRLREMVQTMRNSLELPWLAKRAGHTINSRGANEAVRQLVPAVMELKRQMDTKAFKEPDLAERMVRIYARKVDAGEIPMSKAVDTMVNIEERNVKPTGFNPVHQTYTYPKGSPGPENRIQREEVWTNRIAAAIDKLDAGTLWDDVKKAPRLDAPAPEMRMKM